MLSINNISWDFHLYFKIVLPMKERVKINCPMIVAMACLVLKQTTRAIEDRDLYTLNKIHKP
jgi:hypothetical protein